MIGRQRRLGAAGTAVLVLLTALATVLTACGGIDSLLPADPIEFNTKTFVNPDDAEDTYLSIEYAGRTYIPYGTLKNRITGKDVGPCLGYIVQDGERMEDVRIFPLTADPENDYLLHTTEGFMDQPLFFRAVDTRGEEIPAPAYIESLSYGFW